MSNNQNTLGSVVSLFRYPVKSMMGEELNATHITQQGLLGDRYFAIVDSADGKAGSAKNPRKWPNLFDYRATFTEPPMIGENMPTVRITLPDGTMVTNEQNDLNLILSKAFHREVTLKSKKQSQEKITVKAEEYWPDMEELDYQDTVTDFALPEGTFFDTAMIHLVTTATLDKLREIYPQGRFEARRFRPNIVIAPSSNINDFIENDWIEIGRASCRERV